MRFIWFSAILAAGEVLVRVDAGARTALAELARGPGDAAPAFRPPLVPASDLLLALDFDCTLTTQHLYKTLAGLAGVAAFTKYVPGLKDFVKGLPFDAEQVACQQALEDVAALPKSDLEHFMNAAVRVLPAKVLREYFLGDAARLNAVTGFLQDHADRGFELAVLTAGFRSVARGFIAKAAPEWRSFFPGPFEAADGDDLQTMGLGGRQNAAPALQAAFDAPYPSRPRSNEDAKLQRLGLLLAEPGRAARALLVDDGTSQHVGRFGEPAAEAGQTAFMLSFGLQYEGRGAAGGPGLRSEHLDALKAAIEAHVEAAPDARQCGQCALFFLDPGSGAGDDPIADAAACCLNAGDVYYTNHKVSFRCQAGLPPQLQLHDPVKGAAVFVLEAGDAALRAGDVVTYASADGADYNTLVHGGRYEVVRVEGAHATLRALEGLPPLDVSFALPMRKEDTFTVEFESEYTVTEETFADLHDSHVEVYTDTQTHEAFPSEADACEATQFASCQAYGVSLRSQTTPKRILSAQEHARELQAAVDRTSRKCECQFMDRVCRAKEGYNGRCANRCKQATECAFSSHQPEELCTLVSANPTKHPCKIP